MSTQSTIHIRAEDIQGPFATPVYDQGQMVQRSYACTEDYILVRTSDSSDRSESLEAYYWPTGDAPFEPWGTAPRLGRRVGPAIIEADA